MTEKDPRYAFYEKVRVQSLDRKAASVNGQLGAVLGRVTTDKGEWYYTVYIYSTKESWCFFEHELLPTGEHAQREDFFDNSSVRVLVDKDGRGTIAPKDEG